MFVGSSPCLIPSRITVGDKPWRCRGNSKEIVKFRVSRCLTLSHAATFDSMRQTPTPQGTTLLKPAEAAAELRLSRATIYRLIGSDALPVVYVGARNAARIRREDLDDYVNRKSA